MDREDLEREREDGGQRPGEEIIEQRDDHRYNNKSREGRQSGRSKCIEADEASGGDKAQFQESSSGVLSV